eukprot:gene3430-13476_t
MASNVLSISINQDGSCFACGLTSGFKVFNAVPFKETVMIWDDLQGKCIGELSFRSQVLVYNFADLKLVAQIETGSNVNGLLAVSSISESSVLACPGMNPGQVRIQHYTNKTTKVIAAHDNALACISLSLDGKRLATASEKGTLIRIWNTADGEALQEIRRGLDNSVIYSLALSRFCNWLAITCDKGGAHIFGLDHETVALPQTAETSLGDAETFHRNSSLGAKEGDSTPATALLKESLSTALLSTSSFSQLKLAHGPEGVRSVVAFGVTPNSIVVTTASGCFYRATFDPFKGGEAAQELFSKFDQDAGPGLE